MHRTHSADLSPQSEKTAHISQLNSLRGILTAGLLLVSATLGAGNPIYSWTDADGRRHLSDRPPNGVHAEQIEVQVNTYSAPALPPERVAPTPTASIKTDKVVIYTTRRCGYCHQAKQFMAKNNIPFTEYDIETSARGKADYRKLNGRGVPIILVGEQRMNGYSEGNLTNLLRKGGHKL